MPTLPASTAVIRVRSVERSMSPAVTFRETAIKPDTASATSRTRAHHQRDDAAATSPSTSRGTISRQPACWRPRCSETMRLSPIQPRITTRAPDVMAQTTIHAWRTSSWA